MANIRNPYISLIDFSIDGKISVVSSRAQMDVINLENLKVSSLEVKKSTVTIVEVSEPTKVRNRGVYTIKVRGLAPTSLTLGRLDEGFPF